LVSRISFSHGVVISRCVGRESAIHFAVPEDAPKIMTAEELTGDFLLLNQAVWHFAPPELVAEYNRRTALPEPQPPRKKRGSPEGLAQLSRTANLMRHQTFVCEPLEEAKRYLFGLLFHKRLQAWGVMRKPIARIKQEPIPSEIFDNPTMGWKDNVIKRFEYCYVSVVVKLPRSGEAQNSIITPAAMALHPPQEAGFDSLPSATLLKGPPLVVTSGPGSTAKDRKGRGGRPPVAQEIRAVIRELKPTGALDNISKKRMYDVIREAARKKHPGLFPTEKQPGVDKIREALRAEME